MSTNNTDNRRKTASQKSARSMENYQTRVARHKKRAAIRSAVLIVLAIAVVVGGKLFWDYHHYNKYKVVSSTEKQDAAATRYQDMNGNIFRYSANGASLIDKKENVLWDKTFEMENPEVDVCEETVAVYEKQGNQIYIFNGEGALGEVTTELPILKCRVSTQGVIGAILQDGETTWINFYASDGSVIATGKTRIDSPGYPVDLAISKDGTLIMISYLFVEGDKTTSHVAFYNLGADNSGEIDNIVSGYQYEDKLVPQVAYMDETTSVAFRDDGFVIYTGATEPKEAATVTTKKEIISTFYDEDYVGFVTSSDEGDKQFALFLYNKNGKQVFTKDFNIQYTTIKLNHGQILMQNDAQICIFSTKGVEKFNGTVDEGNIADIFKTGINQYMLVLESGFTTIKLN